MRCNAKPVAEVTPDAPESRVQAEVIRLLRLAQAPHDMPPFHVHDSRRCAEGFPDVIATVRGRVYAVEVKTNTGVLKAAQLCWLANLAGCGVTALVVTEETLGHFAQLLGVAEPVRHEALTGAVAPRGDSAAPAPSARPGGAQRPVSAGDFIADGYPADVAEKLAGRVHR